MVNNALDNDLSRLKQILGHNDPKSRKFKIQTYRVCKQYSNAYEYHQKKKDIERHNKEVMRNGQ